MATRNVLIIHPDGTVKHTDIDDDLRSYQAAVEGNIEGLFGPDATVYANEEGLLHGLLPNPRATLFVQQVMGLSVFLVGSVLIVGPGDGEGGDTDVRPDVVGYFNKEN